MKKILRFIIAVDEYQQPYTIYQTEDGNRYFLWYQDDASIQVSMNAAKLLGVTGTSIWRLGIIPQGDWNLSIPREIAHRDR